ncbi:MAG: ElyC/SanA/YdcF family protein, partial [Alphaproteobacteria bacterium]
DEASRDTLQSVLNCGHILRQRVGHGDTVFVCTSRYHMPRCVWLFRMSGCAVRAGRMVADRPSMKLSSLTYLYGREVPATAWDTVVMAARRVTGRMSGAVGRSA